MKKSYLFISDVHLGLQIPEQEKKKEEQLVSFLKYAQTTARELYILGDLFDYWFEYKHVYPKGFFRTLTALQDLTSSGTKVHYLIGNHDFFHKDFFTKEIGCALYENPINVIIDGKRFHLSHGDGLLKKDVGYKILKSILRNKFFQMMFSLVHPDLGIALASKTSKTSREYTKQKDYGEIDGMFEAAKQKIEQDFDYVIYGHSHNRVISRYNNGFYINLGSWLSEPGYGCFENGELKLLNWNPNVGENDGT